MEKSGDSTHSSSCTYPCPTPSNFRPTRRLETWLWRHRAPPGKPLPALSAVLSGRARYPEPPLSSISSIFRCFVGLFQTSSKRIYDRTKTFFFFFIYIYIAVYKVCSAVPVLKPRRISTVDTPSVERRGVSVGVVFSRGYSDR